MEERTMKGTRQESAEAFTSMMQAAAAPGVVDAKTKRLLAIALSISQRCAPCFRTHLRLALGEGITREEIEEVAWVATSFTGCTGRMFYQEIMKELGGT